MTYARMSWRPERILPEEVRMSAVIVCMVPDLLPTVVSVRTVVAEEWMDRFVVDLVECPSVSRMSAVDVRAGLV